jgi:hypothetical protein
VIPDAVIDVAAHAALHADHPEASGWSGKPAETKDRYRRIARAVLESAEPDDVLGDVGVTCCFCDDGGYYPPGGWTPVNDDGRAMVYVHGEWWCPTHVPACRQCEKTEADTWPDGATVVLVGCDICGMWACDEHCALSEGEWCCTDHEPDAGWDPVDAPAETSA